MSTELQRHRRRLRERHEQGQALDPSVPYPSTTARARTIWTGMSIAEQSVMDPWFQRGYQSWIFGEPCVNPHDLKVDAWAWAAYQMGWTQRQEENGGR